MRYGSLPLSAMAPLMLALDPRHQATAKAKESEPEPISSRRVCVLGDAPSAVLLDAIRHLHADVCVVSRIQDVPPGAIVVAMDGAGVDPLTADMLDFLPSHDPVVFDSLIGERQFVECLEAGILSPRGWTPHDQSRTTCAACEMQVPRVMGTITALSGTVLQKHESPAIPGLFVNSVPPAPFARFRWGPPAQDAGARRDAKRKAQKRARKRQRVR